jgi:hypothetical protein
MDREGGKRDINQQLMPWTNLICSFVQTMVVGGT